MKNDYSFSIETKTEAWAAVIMSMLSIVFAAVFIWLSYSGNKAAIWLSGAGVFGLAGLAIIPQSFKDLKDVYSTREELESYLEKYHNLELAEFDEYDIDTSTFD